jgi:alpha/beta superfamily hydrolase
MEKIIEFFNSESQKLIGILHEPTDIHRPQGKKNFIVLLNSGLVDKVGPHRLYIKIARRLSSEGYFVLRFDSHGLGDSEGNLKKGSNRDNFLLIQKGIFIDDTLSSVKYLNKEMQPNSISIMGLCGGAVTAILSDAKEQNIKNIILFDPPVYLENSDICVEEDKLIKIEENNITRTFKKKYKTLKESLACLLRIKHGINYESQTKKTLRRPLNVQFVESTLSYIRSKRKVLFILGGNDFIAHEFKFMFEKIFLNNKYRNFFEVLSITHANHEFHSLKAQEILLDKISSWLKLQCEK